MDPPKPVKKRRGRGNRQRQAVKPADDAAELAWADRREKCVRLRASGLTWDEVAKALGYASRGNAYDDFARAIKERPGQAVDEYREQDNEATGLILRGHIDKARKGDARSADVVMKVLAHRARINGYEAAQRVEHTGKDGRAIEITPGDARRVMRELFGDVVPEGAEDAPKSPPGAPTE